jgi:hypothetical protein
MANEIVTEIRLELDKLRADLKEAQNHGEDTAKKIGEGIGGKIEEGLARPFDGLKEKFLEIAAVVGAAFTFEKAIEEAKEGESALNGLNSAMAVTGTYTDAASAHAIEYAEALQKTTVYSHVAIQQGETLLVTLGKLSGTGLDRATKASLDLAAALRVDVNTAFNLMAKAAEGHVTALSRYGIQVKATGDAHRDFATALNLVETRFKGLAEMQTNTFAGAMAHTQNSLKDLLESLGNLVIKSPLVIAVFKAIGQGFEAGAKAVERWAAGRDVIKELSTATIALGQNLITYVGAPLELVYNIGKIVFESLKTGLQVVVVAVLYLAEKVAYVQEKMHLGAAGVSEALHGMRESATQVLESFAKDTNASMDNIFNFNASAKSSQYLTQLQTFVDRVKPATANKFKEIADAVNNSAVKPNFFSSFAVGFVSATKTMEKAATELGASVHNTINTGVTNSFAAMGAAMAKGQNGMKAFGDAMLGVLGDIAIQFGSTFIAMGIAKTLLFDPTGPLLIAAGATLAVIGGALKGLSGSSGAAAGGAASAPSGGGVASGGGSGAAPVDNAPQSFNDTQRNGTGTNVQVNIQGHVFDRRETGLQIADVLNETFANSGAVLATSGQA